MSRVVDLSCLNCGSNRVRFPDAALIRWYAKIAVRRGIR